MGRPILHIPNLVVREQLFNFLIQGYARHDIFKLDVNRLRTLFENMSFKGDWKPMFEFLAEAIREQSRIREYIEGEAHIKGFLLAYLSMFRYYQLYPEYEMNKGFADFFFKPSPAAPVSPPYTYLLEVKYAKAGASEKEIRALADDFYHSFRCILCMSNRSHKDRFSKHIFVIDIPHLSVIYKIHHQSAHKTRLTIAYLPRSRINIRQQRVT